MDNTSTLAFDKKVHFWGRITVIFALSGFIMVPIIMATINGISIDWAVTLKNAAPILLTFTIAALGENLAYTPIIGAGALYVSCVTGNVSSMKIPASMNAMEIAGCAPGSEKGDVISIIAVCASTFVTTLIVFSGMLFLAPIFAPIYNNPVLKPAFTNLIPSLFGALLIPYILRSPKNSIIPIIVPMITILAVGRKFYAAQQSFIMLGIIAVSMVSAYFINKDVLVKKQDKTEA